MANYLITGAAGFIGAQVARLLLAEGHQVYGVDNLNKVYDVRVKKHRLQSLLPAAGFHFIKDDITDKEIVQRLGQMVPEVAAVINLAAIAGVRASTICTTGSTLARYTSPAPPRNAPSAHRAAAPR